MATSDLILHHHDPSPFAEKIRLVFGIKQLTWRSVQVPMMMPKPSLTALTGGYRGTPVLQIGNEIFCDTRLIAAELERRYPVPAIFRTGALVNFGLQHWGDETVFPPGAALAMHDGRGVMPPALLEERAQYFSDLDFSRFADDAGYFRRQISAHMRLIERQLDDGRPFLLGDHAEWADICAYFPLWMLKGHVADASLFFAACPHVERWLGNLDAYGNGTRVEIGADDAIDAARTAPVLRPEAGREVRVFPEAHPETAATGHLVRFTDDIITIRRSTELIGEIDVHFPAIGYRVEARS